MAGIRVPLIDKLFGGCHGENVKEDEDEDDRLRMFKSLLPLIDQGELDVSQSGNFLVIRSQPNKSGGTVIPILRYLLSSNKKKGSGLLLGPNSPFSQIPLLGALL